MALMTAMQIGELEEKGVAVEGEQGAEEGQDQAEEEGGARGGEDSNRRHHDGDLQECFTKVEIRVLARFTSRSCSSFLTSCSISFFSPL